MESSQRRCRRCWIQNGTSGAGTGETVTRRLLWERESRGAPECPGSLRLSSPLGSQYLQKPRTLRQVSRREKNASSLTSGCVCVSLSALLRFAAHGLLRGALDLGLLHVEGVERLVEAEPATSSTRQHRRSERPRSHRCLTAAMPKADRKFRTQNLIDEKNYYVGSTQLRETTTPAHAAPPQLSFRDCVPLLASRTSALGRRAQASCSSEGSRNSPSAVTSYLRAVPLRRSAAGRAVSVHQRSRQ